MPARPDPRPARLKRMGKMAAYLLTELHETVPVWIIKVERGEGKVADLDKLAQFMCARLQALAPLEMETIVYDAHVQIARRLADWWEAHQRADAKAKLARVNQRAKAILKRAALAKLTPEEREALGLEDEKG